MDIRAETFVHPTLYTRVTKLLIALPQIFVAMIELQCRIEQEILSVCGLSPSEDLVLRPHRHPSNFLSSIIQT